MAGRKDALTVEQQVELGRAVVIGRCSGMSWKSLVRVYGRSKATLWRCVQAAQMKHNSSEMKHLEACNATG